MPSYLLPHTQIGKKKEICLYKKLFQPFNPHSHLKGTLINLYMNEKKFFGSGKGGGPLKDRRNQQNKSVGI